MNPRKPQPAFETSQLMYRKVLDAHNQVFTLLQELRPVIANLSQEELANCSYAIREMIAFHESLRKELEATRKQIDRTACARWMNDPNRPEKIETDYCTATPDIKQNFSPPTLAKNPAEYKAMMTYLGIDPQLWDQGEFLSDRGLERTEVVKVAWEGFQRLCNLLAEAGYELPAGIRADCGWTEFMLRIRKNRGVIEAL